MQPGIPKTPAEESNAFCLLADAIPQIVWVTRPDGGLEYANQKYYEYANATFEDIADIRWLHYIHPKDQEKVQVLWQTTLITGKFDETEFRMRNGKTGEYRWFLAKGIPVKDTYGRIVRWFGINTDIHEKKLAEEAGHQNNLKELDKRKDEFIGLASHEMKTPLASLKLLAQYLTRKLRKGDLLQAEEYLEQMQDQIDTLTGMVNDLLDVSKIEAGQLTYAEKPFDFDALVHQAGEKIQQTSTTHRLLIQGASHKIMVGDKHRIEQVLTNLIGNAIKYSPQADTVEIKIIPHDDTVAVGIRDYGFGITEEQQQKIFERFYRVAPKKETGIAGLGVGLSISHGIVKHYGGTLTLESELGKGSTFMVSFPCKEETVR